MITDPTLRTLARGQEMLAIPGPSITPERVLQAMNVPMSNIYAGEVSDISWEMIERLPTVARTTGRVFMMISNGHGAWQMALNNTFSRGDKILVADSPFAATWSSMAKQSGIEVVTVVGDGVNPVDPSSIADRLAQDTAHEIQAVLTVYSDTATSARADLPAIRAAIDSANHPALFMVDCVASLGCEQYEMDAWGIDLTVGASQKGIMVPPGMAFVWANERVVERAETADLNTMYFDWRPRANPDAIYQLYAGTPPVQHLFGLREALTMLLDEEGLEAAWARHQVHADAVRAAVNAWATDGGLSLNVTDPRFQSNAVTTINAGTISSDHLRKVCEDDAGLVLGIGLPRTNNNRFRIGHMGYLNPPMILGTLATVEAALHTIGAPVGGSGVQAASQVVAAAMKTFKTENREGSDLSTIPSAI